MTPERLAEIKRNWHNWPVTDLLAEIEQLQAKNEQLKAYATEALVRYTAAAAEAEGLQVEIERLQGVINQQAELIRKYEIDNRQLEHLLKSYKDMEEE